MFSWKNGFNLLLDAKGEGAEGGGTGTGDQGTKKAGDEGDKGAGQSEDDGKGGESEDSKLDPKVQKMLKDLRDENAKHRTKNKELGAQSAKLKQALVEAGIIQDDEEAPEEKVKALSQENNSLAVKSALLEAAVEHGVPKDSLKYFSFLVSDRMSQLQDGEEVTEEEIASLASEAKARSASKSGVQNSSVGNSGKGTPNPGGKGDVTVDQFVRMNMGEKSKIFTENPALYDKLMSEARSKKLQLRL
jgi:hypothetical protein